ncbi:MAG: NAD(+)/NADH kinase [Limnobacter sp.]|nr:NAD(+)/NADH kinase [Limnobacter sp.]
MPNKQTTCVAVFGKHKSSAAPLWKGVAKLLQQHGYSVLVGNNAKQCENTQFELADIETIREKADIAVITGGDGTFLGIARQLAGYQIPLIGINQGRLGFLTDIRHDEIDPILLNTLAGEHFVEKRSYLSGRLIREGRIEAECLALNDIVISRGIVGGMVELNVEVDGKFMYDLRADGLIVSTPTGSTAYSLSADGPILHPSLAGLVMVPVAPHALTNRPIALPDSSTIVIEVTGGKQTGVHFDMQNNFRARVGDTIEIRMAESPIELMHPAKYDYFAMLRQKLHWSASPTELNHKNRGLRESFHAK